MKERCSLAHVCVPSGPSRCPAHSGCPLDVHDIWGVSGAQAPRSELASSSGLGWLSPGLTLSLPRQVDEQIHACYAQTMAEWLGCEAIVRQRERESHAAALAKCSSGASLDGHLHQMRHRDATISNEVMGGTHLGARGWGRGGKGRDLLRVALVGTVTAVWSCHP